MNGLEEWLAARGGIAHRAEALDAGFSPGWLQRATRRGSRIERVRRWWLVLNTAPADAVAAVRSGGRLACVTIARRRGWWQPEGMDRRLHLSLLPGARSDGLGEEFDGVAHWSKPVAPVSRYDLCESVEDALGHIALCLSRPEALAVWESASRREGLSPLALRAVRWNTQAAAWCAEHVTGLVDSGLESYFVYRLRPWGVPFRLQVRIAGHLVDVLIGERLVAQVDGYAHHSSSSDRTRDVAHDAELRLRGYTVLRFTYAQVIHDWPAVARVISRAMAAGAHLAA
ncbi:endonuclease domain-containing protein [Microbacterium sp. RD1]|uniref:endonuclease domain-containing protein n=1 Tax=Microbacterium sp. RD1 TaxID=3457313 RepID=UPI003FA58F9B